MSPLGLLNFLVLQWFGMRLAAMKVEVNRSQLNGDIKTYVFYGWKLLYWICPLTGWWNDYWWISKPRVRAKIEGKIQL